MSMPLTRSRRAARALLHALAQTIVCAAMFAGAAQAQDVGLDLSAQQRGWIAAHPVLRAAGGAVASLNEGADLTLQQVAEIAAAMAQQRSAAKHIAEQIERISAMALDNRADAENNAEVTGKLGGLSSELQTAIANFRV